MCIRDKLLGLGVRTVLALILFVIGSRLIAMIRHFFRRAMERSSASEEAAQFLDSSIKFVSYTILVFMILQLFGVEAASIATVIGSVGVTIGLAIQGSLSNCIGGILIMMPVSYTHLRAHETRHDLVCRLLLEKKKQRNTISFILL